MKKIVIACQCATNKGDRAIAEYLISAFSDSDDIETVLSTSEPKLWKNILPENVRVVKMGYRSPAINKKSNLLGRISREITAFIYNRILFRNMLNENSNHKLLAFQAREFVNEVKSAELVIVTGGHHITSIRNKNALFAYTYDIGLVKLFAEKYVLWSQTIGPLNFTSDKAKSFFGDVIKEAHRVYIRDENSKECIERLYGPQNNIIKSYDSVFGYGNRNYGDYADREKKVGISIFNGLPKAFDTFPVIADILDGLAERGYTVEFFRMEAEDKEENDIRSLISLMKNTDKIKFFPFGTTTQEHLAELSTCEIYIGYKTHSVIMSLATGTPLLAIAYHKKTFDFMREYGLEAYALNDEELTSAGAKKILDKILENKLQIHTAAAEKSFYTANCLEKNIKEILLDVKR